MNSRFFICILFWLLALGSFVLVSCEPDKVCHQELQATAQIILSADSINAAGDTISYTQWDSVLVVGVGNDVGMKNKNIKGIGLELRPDTTLTQYFVYRAYTSFAIHKCSMWLCDIPYYFACMV